MDFGSLPPYPVQDDPEPVERLDYDRVLLVLTLKALPFVIAWVPVAALIAWCRWGEQLLRALP